MEAAVAGLERGSIEVGQIPRYLDASGILLGMAEREDGANSGHRIRGPGGHL
jgi:hypothetical protein